MHMQRKTDRLVAKGWRSNLQWCWLCVPSSLEMDFCHSKTTRWASGRQRMCILSIWWHFVCLLAYGRCTMQAELIYNMRSRTRPHQQNPAHLLLAILRLQGSPAALCLMVCWLTEEKIKSRRPAWPLSWWTGCALTVATRSRSKWRMSSLLVHDQTPELTTCGYLHDFISVTGSRQTKETHKEHTPRMRQLSQAEEMHLTTGSLWLVQPAD